MAQDTLATTFKRLGQSELLPRYIFAESLYARRRITLTVGTETIIFTRGPQSV